MHGDSAGCKWYQFCKKKKLSHFYQVELEMCTSQRTIPIPTILTGGRECQSEDKIQTWRLLASIIPDNLSGSLMKSMNEVARSHYHHLSVHLEAKSVEADQNLSHPGSRWCCHQKWGRGLAARQIVLAHHSRCWLPQRRAATGARRACSLCTRCSVRVAQFRCRGSPATRSLRACPHH